VGDITAQSLTTRVAGNVEQHTPISDLAIGIPELIAYASTVTTLKPGDVIATGTPGGVGNHRKPSFSSRPACRRGRDQQCRNVVELGGGRNALTRNPPGAGRRRRGGRPDSRFQRED
jgi:2-keto-4-pentenoate hydratase/2-oxohepta-3-ene-1,7-dioic acid hydratase in catechol pathway